MSLTQHIQQHNARYAQQFDRSRLALAPARPWAIVACMDARLTVEDATGVGTGDAHIIRNAGGLMTDDALRSLLISTHLLGTNEFAIIEHTGCGMLTFEEEPVRRQIAERTGAATDGLRLYPFRDLETNLREQVRRVATSPLFPKGIPITGFIYEVETGRLRPAASATTGE
ncbi:MAG: carbonic anhydrase [Chloroflexota bacterium]|nr:carbonic anhydrase [Chloroflexota bacterium]